MIVKLLRRVLQIHSFVHVSVALEAPGSADAEAPRSSVVEAPGIAVVRALGSVAVEAPCSVVAEAPGSVDVEAPESADSAVASTDEKDDPRAASDAIDVVDENVCDSEFGGSTAASRKTSSEHFRCF